MYIHCFPLEGKRSVQIQGDFGNDTMDYPLLRGAEEKLLQSNAEKWIGKESRLMPDVEEVKKKTLFETEVLLVWQHLPLD